MSDSSKIEVYKTPRSASGNATQIRENSIIYNYIDMKSQRFDETSAFLDYGHRTRVPHAKPVQPCSARAALLLRAQIYTGLGRVHLLPTDSDDPLVGFTVPTRTGKAQLGFAQPSVLDERPSTYPTD